MEKSAAKKKLNIVDFIIIAILLMAIVGVAMRMLLIKNTPDPLSLPDIEEQEFIVSYIIRDQRESIATYLDEDEKGGKVFRFANSNKPFGTTIGKVDKDDADRHYFADDGSYVTVKNTAEISEDGKDISHLKRYDMTGSFKVKGKLTEDKSILVITGAEEDNVVVNRPVYIRSNEMLLTVYVTSIVPVE